MKYFILLLVLSYMLFASIPQPKDQRAEIITHANVSTLKYIDVYFADQDIPHTYATHKISNVTGFKWYVSKHFALQTNYNSEEARKALQLLELAYPQWVNYLNAEPEDMHDTRIPIVYAQKWEDIKNTVGEYGFLQSPGRSGEMMYYNTVAYTHGANPEYLLLHEGFHAFSDSFRNGLKTGWFTEGAAQDAANSIANDDWTQLASFIFDHGNYSRWATHIKNWAKKPPSVDKFTEWGPSYNRGGTIQHFFKDDPLRNQYWKIWAKSLATDYYKRGSNRQYAESYSDKVIYSLFGSKDEFRNQWETWLKNTKLSTESTGYWSRDENRLFLIIIIQMQF